MVLLILDFIVLDKSINPNDSAIKPVNTTDKIKWSIFDLLYLRPTTIHKVMLKIMENIL